MEPSENHEVVRHLGQAVRVIERYTRRRLPLSVIDTLLANPAAGMGLLAPYMTDLPEKAQALLAQVLDPLPADLPAGPVAVADQSGFWLGYWQSLPGEEPSKPSSIYLELAPARKAAYVQAAQRQGQKLVPWVLAQLDKAARE